MYYNQINLIFYIFEVILLALYIKIFQLIYSYNFDSNGNIL